MAELMAEYVELAPAILMLIIGAKLAFALTQEARFLGIFLALIGAMTLLLTSLYMAIGGIMALVLFCGIAKDYPRI